MGCCASRRAGRNSIYKSLLKTREDDKQTRGNEDNAELLVSHVLRHEENTHDIHIPRCINYLCLHYFYEATNVVFDTYDHSNAWHVRIKEDDKKVTISSNTIFIFSDVGYSSGYHSWNVKLHNAYNCQALGITEKNNATYRHGYNIFDAELNKQLGERYIYAGDQHHGWRGSTEIRPYILSADGNGLMMYDKALKLKNNMWNPGDIITVELNCCDPQWTVAFRKNGQYLANKIKIHNGKMYYPVFQAYQRATFEIVDD